MHFQLNLVQNADCFLCSPMYETLDSGNFAQVPTITGTNSEEQLRVYSSCIYLSWPKNLSDINPCSFGWSWKSCRNIWLELPTLLLPNIDFKNSVDASDAALPIKEQYAGDGSVEEDVAALVRVCKISNFNMIYLITYIFIVSVFEWGE